MSSPAQPAPPTQCQPLAATWRAAARSLTGIVVIPPYTPSVDGGAWTPTPGVPCAPALVNGGRGRARRRGSGVREGGVRRRGGRAPTPLPLPAAPSPSPDVNWDPFPLVSAILDSNSGQRRRRARWTRRSPAQRPPRSSRPPGPPRPEATPRSAPRPRPAGAPCRRLSLPAFPALRRRPRPRARSAPSPRPPARHEPSRRQARGQAPEEQAGRRRRLGRGQRRRGRRQGRPGGGAARLPGRGPGGPGRRGSGQRAPRLRRGRGRCRPRRLLRGKLRRGGGGGYGVGGRTRADLPPGPGSARVTGAGDPGIRGAGGLRRDSPPAGTVSAGRRAARAGCRHLLGAARRAACAAAHLRVAVTDPGAVPSRPARSSSLKLLACNSRVIRSQVASGASLRGREFSPPLSRHAAQNSPSRARGDPAAPAGNFSFSAPM